MLQRIVKQPIQIVRNGQITYPEVGSLVELEPKEAEAIGKLNPAALGFPAQTEEPLSAMSAKKPAGK